MSDRLDPDIRRKWQQVKEGRSTHVLVTDNHRRDHTNDILLSVTEDTVRFYGRDFDVRFPRTPKVQAQLREMADTALRQLTYS